MQKDYAVRVQQIMTCTMFNGSPKNKFLSCLPALLEPAPADAGNAGRRPAGLWKAGDAGMRTAQPPAPGPRAAGAVPEPALADPQGQCEP